jgi:ABC-type Fe3+/spermidine/putrescine transport system ATPase subunit
MPATNAISLRELRTADNGGATRGAPLLAGLSLDVPQGEAVVIVGPDPTANQAVLLAAAGLLDLVEGRVLAEGRDVSARPPHRRGLALVASDRGLRGMGGVAAGTVEAVVRVAARGLDVRPILLATGLADQARRRLAELAPAGLRRVALAQAVASSPICLLVDNPARGLDSAGASEVFSALHGVREAGMAMLIATTETRTALAVAERGVVMVGGAARQAGWLRDLHDNPADDATAGLLGEINRLPGRVLAEADDIVTVRLDCGPIVEARRADAAVGANCVVCVRPGRVALAGVTAEIMGPGSLSGRVRGQRFFGDLLWVDLEIGTERGRPPALLGVARPAVVPMKLAVGDTVALAWQPHHAMAFRPMRGE